MKTQTKTIRLHYPRDNDLNAFGDFDQIECRQTRNVDKPLDVVEEWALVGDKGCLVLDKDAAFQCLKNFFFVAALAR